MVRNLFAVRCAILLLFVVFAPALQSNEHPSSSRLLDHSLVDMYMLPENKFLLVSHNEICLSNAKLEYINQIYKESNYITTSGISPDYKKVAIVVLDARNREVFIKVVDRITHKTVSLAMGKGIVVNSIQFSDNEHVVLATCKANSDSFETIVLSINSLKPVKHKLPPSSTMLSIPNRKLLVFYVADGSVCFYNYQLTEEKRIRGFTEHIEGFSYNSEMNFLVCYSKREVFLVSLDDFSVFKKFHISDRISFLLICSDKRILVVSGSDMFLVDHEGTVLKNYPSGHDDPIIRSALSFDPKMVFTFGYNDRTIKTWRLKLE